MTHAQITNVRLVADSMDFNGLPDLGDNALLYAGSATWSDWRNHVPQILVNLWSSMTEESRLAVYLTAKQVTVYESPPAAAGN